MDFDDEYSNQSIITLIENVEEATIDAKADEGWNFVKWVDGDDKEVSKEQKFTFKLEENVNNIYKAVFAGE